MVHGLAAQRRAPLAKGETMTVEERLKSTIGDLVFQVAALSTQLEQSVAKIAELEAEAKKSPELETA